MQSFAAEARTSLMKAVRARIDAALEPNSLAQSDSPRAYRELTEEIQRNGGGEQGRAKTAERHAYRWFNRIMLCGTWTPTSSPACMWCPVRNWIIQNALPRSAVGGEARRIRG